MQLETWSIDEQMSSSGRAALAAAWEPLSVELDEDALPTMQAQEESSAALHWLRNERARYEEMVREAVGGELDAAQQGFSEMLSEMCLDQDD